MLITERIMICCKKRMRCSSISNVILITQKRNVMPVINAMPGMKTENLLNSNLTNGIPAIKPNNGVVIKIVSSSLFLSFLFFKISFMLHSDAAKMRFAVCFFNCLQCLLTIFTVNGFKTYCLFFFIREMRFHLQFLLRTLYFRFCPFQTL